MNMQSGSNDALPRQVTIKQASKIWGIPEWTLRKYISQRRCPPQESIWTDLHSYKAVSGMA